MYKKCIACSICDHFYHGKCLDLSKDDINKIESVCNFYMCTICNENTLPKFVEDTKKDISLTRALKTPNQCFTCTENISKAKYTNKFFIYNGIKRCVCRKCSYLGRDIPVREKDNIEFLDCSICTKVVKY